MRPIAVVLPLAVGALAACADEPLGPDRAPPAPAGDPAARFSDRTTVAGFTYSRAAWFSETGEVVTRSRPDQEHLAIAGGVAAGDIDNDGDIDLFVAGGGFGRNVLYLNRGDGVFQDVSTQYGIDDTPVLESGPLFVDYDGDGYLDLILGGALPAAEQDEYRSIRVLRSLGGQGFSDVTAATGLTVPAGVNTYSVTAGDVDGDGFLDLFLSHWVALVERPGASAGTTISHGGHFLWRNDGAGGFVDVTSAYGLDSLLFTFTANFADVDNDGDLDLLVASDFRSSSIWINDGLRFVPEPTSVLTDGNGMGAAVGDYDNDGDLDWFVTSIWDPGGVAEGHWDVTGNRLYRNDGAGRFTDVSLEAGVRRGYWGWGSCFADFDNDGHLDLFHVNGMHVGDNPIFTEFWADPSRLFLSNGDGTFTERSAEFGLFDMGQGRGVVCFDADRDGDIDLFVANNGESPRFYLNEGMADGNNFLEIALRAPSPGTRGIGARITLTTPSGATQIREIRRGSNFVSNNPAEAHFGLGEAESVRIRVAWPDGRETVLEDVAANQVLVIRHPGL